jgi:CHAT domain-containing protein
MWLGLAAWRLGDYVTSRQEGEASLALKRRLSLDAELSRSFNALGLLAWNEGRQRDALILFDSAIISARRNHDDAGVARAAGNIPLIKVELGDFDGARKGFDEALVAGRAVDDDRIQGNALANLAMLEIRLGGASRALPLLDSARRHYAAIEYATGEANAMGQLATAWSALGDLQSAISAADSGLRIARTQGLQQEIASTLEVVADLNAQSGNLRLALRNLREADSLDRRLGIAVERGTNLRRTSIILLTLGEIPAAIASARKAVAAHTAVDAYAEKAYDRLQLAEALGKSGDIKRAQAQTDSALNELRGMRSPSGVREASAVSARLALESRDPQLALKRLGSSDRNSSGRDWRLLDLRAEALFELKRFAEAESVARDAVRALERERASLALGPLRSGYLASRAAPFSRLVQILLARRDTAAAFNVAASVPGRSLAERLGGLAVPRGSMADAIQRERLLLKVAAMEQQLAEVDTGAGREEQRSSITRALEAARAAYEEQLSRGTLTGLATGSSPSLESVQQSLAPDDVVLAFLSGPARIDCFAVRSNRVYQWSLLISDRDLSARVRVAREAIGASKQDAVVPAAVAELYDLLVRPAINAGLFTNATRTFVIPHAALGALPFAALWDRRAGRFFIEDQELTYLPSVAALTIENRMSQRPFAQVAVFAPYSDSLPGTVAEARAVSRLVPRVVLRIGRNATEHEARSAISAGIPIHIASHGSHNSQNPLFSRVIVGRAKRGSSADDGRLEVHEILAMSTTSPLVFLSGCETALGSAGDGPFAHGGDEGSLAQAFLTAGARSVVATLWRVNDAGAVRMAESFYRHLRAGATTGAALSRAQREAIRRSGDFTWAAYVVSTINE